jgi:hypothetical protein
MPSVTFHPDLRSVEVREGERLLAAAWKAGVGIKSVCGGHGKCGSRHAHKLEHIAPRQLRRLMVLLHGALLDAFHLNGHRKKHELAIYAVRGMGLCKHKTWLCRKYY